MKRVEYPFKSNKHKENISKRRRRVSADGTVSSNKHERKAKMDKAMQLILRWNDVLSCEHCVFNKIGNKSVDCKGSLVHSDGRKKFCVDGNKWFYYCKAKLAISDERILEMKFDNLSEGKKEIENAHYTVYEELQKDDTRNDASQISERTSNKFSEQELMENGII